jgi:regulator of CtrA degradation
MLLSPQGRTHNQDQERKLSCVKREALDMSEQLVNQTEPVSFGERLAGSQAFADLFRDGMALVEETASYLDGPGRKESKKLERMAALAYATESMRLTTRLMQLASWLLLHRAVKEGEMSLAQANKEKTKVKLAAGESGSEESVKLLPERLRGLITRSKALQTDIRRLDVTMHPRPDFAELANRSNPVERQLGLLKAAFETDDL